MRWLAFVLVALMLVVSIGTAMMLVAESAGIPIGRLPSNLPSSSVQPAEPSPTLGVPLAFGVPDSPSPNPEAQSRLWFNDGAWWGVLLDDVTSDFRIFRLDVASQTWSDTGVVVEERNYGRMDVLWDGEHLVVASAGSQPHPRHALRITRYRYDVAAQTYLRDANFPISITEAGVEAVNVARSSDGRLWVAYRDGSRLAVDHSVGSDLTWRGPAAPVPAEGTIEEIALAALGDHVALVWTRPSENLVSIALHDVTGPTDVWQATSTTIPGLRQGDDQLSVAAYDAPGAERLFVAVRASPTAEGSRGRLDPQVVVVEFAPGDEPATYLFGRVEDQHVNPLVLVDGEARELYVIATAPNGGGTIYYKRASLDHIAFPSGLGSVLIPATEDHPTVDHAVSTKWALDAASGLVVMAADPGAGLYLHGSLGISADPNATPAPTPTSVVAEPLLENTFDGLAVGGPVPGWNLEGEPPESFTIRVLSGQDSSARLSSTSATLEARACAPLLEVSEGLVRAEAETLFNVGTEEDVRLLQVGGVAGELASIRLRGGEVVYLDGAERVRSDVRLVPGRWYRSILALDLAAQTYGIELRDAVTDALLLSDDALGWRFTDSPIVNRVCAELPAQPGLDLYLDDVRVTSTVP